MCRMGIFHSQYPQVVRQSLSPNSVRSGIQEALSFWFPNRLREETRKQYGRYPGYCPATHIRARCASWEVSKLKRGERPERVGSSALRLQKSILRRMTMKRKFARTTLLISVAAL